MLSLALLFVQSARESERAARPLDLKLADDARDCPPSHLFDLDLRRAATPAINRSRLEETTARNKVFTYIVITCWQQLSKYGHTDISTRGPAYVYCPKHSPLGSASRPRRRILPSCRAAAVRAAI
jgi:hypothetical protein